jgi:hypothetical protein
MLNQENIRYSTRCILCDAEIPEEQNHQSGAMMDLCLSCTYRSERAPELFANCIQRFLIGNVL